MLLEASSIERRVGQLAEEVQSDYPTPPLVVGILNGAVQFMMDLLAHMPEAYAAELVYDFVDLSSYDGEASRGTVQWTKDLSVDIKGRDVLVVDGIVDSGRTLRALLGVLSQRQARSVKVCALLDKPARRVYQVPLDYCGFRIADHFVVGYGMDYDQRYRALKYVGIYQQSDSSGKGGSAHGA